MPDLPPPKPLWTAAEIAVTPTRHLKHPLNSKSDIFIIPLSEAAGLRRAVLTLARVPPGKESFLYHWHEHDEEFVYILSGRGRAEIDGKVYEVGAGDFMGFTAPGPAHQLTNPYAEDLVYLMGGERSRLDVGHFPKIGRKIVFGESGIYGVEDKDIKVMQFADWRGKEDG
jgi:uncharacterized cupin superfamily protein